MVLLQMSRLLSLTQGKSAIVDDEDWERVRNVRWQYSSRNGGYAKRTIRHGAEFETIHLHRFLMGAGPGEEVDHKNGNGLDNRKSNLRLCSHSQNLLNRHPNRRAASPYKGVGRNTRSGRWTAAIRFQGVRQHLGTFDNEEDAARAYDTEARRRGGEYAYLNFP